MSTTPAPPLATVEDVAALLGRPLSGAEEARAGVLLEQVSARFRREARQEFTPGESTVRLRVDAGAVHLPQRPATEVVAVTYGDGRPVVHWTHQGQLVTVSNLASLAGVAINADADAVGTAPGSVVVTYRHGAEVPPDARGAVAGAVQRAIGADPEAAQGAAQVTDSAGAFSRTRQFASWAVGGQALLSPDDLALARSFRAVRPRLWVMRP